MFNGISGQEIKILIVEVEAPYLKSLQCPISFSVTSHLDQWILSVIECGQSQLLITREWKSISAFQWKCVSSVRKKRSVAKGLNVSD